MREDGYILNDLGNPVADTLQCAHCGGHFEVKPGSGKRRGWCLKCSAPLCGQAGCMVCVPMERMLERIEAAARK